MLKESPADIFGVMRNNVLITINEKLVYNFELDDITAVFQEKEKYWLSNHSR